MKDTTKILNDKIKADVKSTVEIKCYSSKDTSWFFSRDTIPPTPVLIGHKNVLKIDSVTLLHDGIYYCYGSYSNGVHFLDEVWLYVYSK